MHARPSTDSVRPLLSHCRTAELTQPGKPGYGDTRSVQPTGPPPGQQLWHRIRAAPYQGGPAGQPACLAPSVASPFKELHGRSALTDTTSPRTAAKKRPPPAPPGPPARGSPRPGSLTGWADRGRLLPHGGGADNTAPPPAPHSPPARGATSAGQGRAGRGGRRAPGGGLQALAVPPPPIGGDGAARPVRVPPGAGPEVALSGP